MKNAKLLAFACGDGVFRTPDGFQVRIVSAVDLLVAIGFNTKRFSMWLCSTVIVSADLQGVCYGSANRDPAGRLRIPPARILRVLTRWRGRGVDVRFGSNPRLAKRVAFEMLRGGPSCKG